MALVKAIALLNEAIKINIESSNDKKSIEKLNNIYNNMKLELKGLTKKDLDYLSKHIINSRQVSITNYSRGSIIANEELRKIEVYSNAISIVSEAYRYCVDDNQMQR